MRKKANKDSNFLQQVLINKRRKNALNYIIGGGDRYYESNTDWGWGSEDNPFELPEITVTPEGNSWDNTWEDNVIWTPNDDFWNSNDDDFSCGGCSGLPNVENENNSQFALDTIMNSINNGSALLLEIENSKAYKLLSASSFVSSVPSFQADLITFLTHNDVFLKKCGDFLSGSSLIANSAVTLIGVADGDVTTSDWLNIASCIFSGMGLILFTSSPASLICGGVSIILSVVSLCYSGTDNNSTPNNY